MRRSRPLCWRRSPFEVSAVVLSTTTTTAAGAASFGRRRLSYSSMWSAGNVAAVAAQASPAARLPTQRHALEAASAPHHSSAYGSYHQRLLRSSSVPYRWPREDEFESPWMAASTAAQIMHARSALAARLAAGPLPHPRSAAPFGCAEPSVPPLSEEVSAAAMRAVLALRQTQRLIYSGAQDHQPAAAASERELTGDDNADGGFIGETEVLYAEDRRANWRTFSRSQPNTDFPPRGWEGDSKDPDAAEAPVADDALSSLRRASYGAALSSTEMAALLRWCGGELVSLADTLEAAVMARELKARQETTVEDDEVGRMDGTATRAPSELREAQRRLYSPETAVPTPRGAAAPLHAPFLDPVNAVDLVEVSALLLSLLDDFLRTLVEDVLVVGTTVDTVRDERALSRVAHDVTRRVAALLGNTVVPVVLLGVAEADKMLSRDEGDRAMRFGLLSPAAKDERAGERFTAALLNFGRDHLVFPERVLRLVVCSQRTAGRRGLDLAGQLYACNAAFDKRHGAAPVAPPPAAELVAARGSYDVVTTLAYVLAQHGEWALCLTLLDPVTPPHEDAKPLASTALAKLLLSVALANASRQELARALDDHCSSLPAASRSLLLASLVEDAERTSGTAYTKDSKRETARMRRGDASSVRQALLFHLVSYGIMPHRPLSVAEYGALIKRFLRRRTPAVSQEETRDGAGTKPSTHSSGGGGGRSNRTTDVSWVLSPSNVWRHTSGFPHHVRSTLCMIGFQVLVKHGLADSMNTEDLLVVLSLTRQIRRQRGRELRQRRQHYQHLIATRQAQRSETDEGEEEAAPGPSTRRDDMVDADDRGQETWEALSGAFPLHLLPAACRTPPAGQEHVLRLCEAYCAVWKACHPLHPQPFAADSTNGTSRRPSAPLAAASPHTGSTVMLSVVSHELLALLKAAHYEHAVGVFWPAMLTAVGTIMSHEGLSPQTVRTLEDLVHALVRAISEEASMPTALTPAAVGSGSAGSTPSSLGATTAAPEEEDDDGCTDGGADAADAASRLLSSATGHEERIASLVGALVRLAPYVSPFTVALAVQSPAGRYLSSQDCLRLAPYAPLGSRSQTQLLLRHVIQSGGGGRAGSGKEAGAPLPVSASVAAWSTHSSTSRGSRGLSSLDSPASPAIGALCAAATVAVSGGRHGASSLIADERLMLSLLTERDWTKALQRFREAPPRVRVAGAPHVVRLVIEADAWRDVDDAQLRPLVRLAVRSARTIGPRGGGGGGVAASKAGETASCSEDSEDSSFAEEMLRTTLDHGMWATGLSFHQLLVEEQPELVRQSRRAQQYAALLCRGLMEKTVLARTIAEVLQATRNGQWEQASAHFVLYATGNSSSSNSSSIRGNTSLLPAESLGSAQTQRLSASRAQNILDALVAKLKVHESAPANAGVAPTTALSAEYSRTFAAQVPSELGAFAQATRYALLYTPQTRDYAFKWFPAAALPVPLPLRTELEARFGRAFLVTHRVLAAQSEASPLKAQRTALLTDEREAEEPAGGPAGEHDPSTWSLSSPTTLAAVPVGQPPSLVETPRRRGDGVVHRPDWSVVKSSHEIVLDALQVLHSRGNWVASLAIYQHALASGCLPFEASATVLRTTIAGGAPWQVTLACFSHMSRRMRPDVLSTTAALEACAAGGQWAMALRVLRQSILTQTTPAPKAVELAIETTLRCGVWSHALQAAHMYRATRSPQLAHTVLNAYVATKHWNDAVEYFYDCTVRGIHPLEASIELALIACEAASEEYRRTAMMVGAIASALEDLYTISGAVLDHIVFVHRHRQWQGDRGGGADEDAVETLLYYDQGGHVPSRPVRTTGGEEYAFADRRDGLRSEPGGTHDPE